MPASNWIVPDALPPNHLANSLSQALQSTHTSLAQQLDAILSRYRVEILDSACSDFGCTPAQRVRLENLGLTQALSPSEATLPIGSAHAALEAQQTDQSQAIWVAQACSAIVSVQGTLLVEQARLQASSQELQALADSLTELDLSNTYGIELQSFKPGFWQVSGQIPSERDSTDAWLPTLQSVQDQEASDAWPTAEIWRIWRQCVNEIQMHWHTHPVNQKRQAEGLPVINTLWLSGGARGWTPQPNADAQWFETFQQHASHGLWSEWLKDWQTLVTQWHTHIFEIKQPQPTVTFTGEDRIIRLTPGKPSVKKLSLGAKIQKLFSRSTPTNSRAGAAQTPEWRNWWNPL